MPKRAFLNVTRGSGREFMSCAVIARELAAKYDTLYLAAFNKYFAEALADELDNVRVIDQAEIASFWNTHYDKVQDNFIAEPYNLSDFSMRRIHFYDAYRKVIGLDEKHDWNENGTSTLPKLVVPKAMQNSAFEFSKQHKKFVIVQFHGGQNPVGVKRNEQNLIVQPYMYNEVGLHRHYPMDKADELCSLLKAEGYEVLQYTLNNEPHCKDALYLQHENNQLWWHALSEYADGIITIDSSLMHLGISNCKKMCVIWVQTSPINFGYQKAVNIISNKVEDFGGPSMAGVPLNPDVNYPDPEYVVKCFKENRLV